MSNYLFEKAAKIERLANRTTLQTVHDTQALQKLLPYMTDYLPWTGSAIRPSALCILLNEVIIHKRTRILEVGCGMSTVLLSRVLKSHPVSIVSIDNDQGWIDVTENSMASDAENCEFIQADLKEQKVGGETYKWYDLEDEKTSKTLEEKPFDLLFVDAPIASICRNSRYPALPMLKKYMADDFVVFLDDIERQPETEIAAQWCEEFDLQFQKSGIIGGLGIMRPKDSPCRFNIG